MVQYNMSKLKTDIRDIPESWIYKYYAEKNDRIINQPFDGRIIKIKSFTNRDSEPSLCIYYNKKAKKYLWKDHSSTLYGDVITFVSILISKTFSVTLATIIKDYEEFIDAGGNLDEYDNANEIKENDVKFEPKIRAFKVNDLDFWRKWKISNTTVSKFNIIPLENYLMERGGHRIRYNNYCFGFYTDNNELYQIYQPEQKVKYLNTKVDYLIGRDQLKFEKDTCIIVSGLKDLMALYQIGLEVEIVAPKSENIMIKHEDIEFLKSKYKYVITMFDNDEPGIKAMQRYQKIYGIPFIHINLEQDLAKNNEKNTLEFLSKYYAIYINKKINE